ncbi:MAG: hypothetical protein ACXWLV_00490 [Rhizomicrobium sp.]
MSPFFGIAHADALKYQSRRNAGVAPCMEHRMTIDVCATGAALPLLEER